MSSTAITQGSVGDIARRTGKTLAEAFLSVDAIVIVDVSGSMQEIDVLRAASNHRRYDEACRQLNELQRQMPGKIAVVAFSDHPIYCPDGIAPLLGSGTNLAAALRMIAPADGCGIRFIVVSDGEPNNEQSCFDIAKTFTTHIDTIYIGPEGGDGADFLRRLAAACKGQSATAAGEILKLQETIERLLKG